MEWTQLSPKIINLIPSNYGYYLLAIDYLLERVRAN